MSILKQIQERRALLNEISKETLSSYKDKAEKDLKKTTRRSVYHQQKHEYADDKDTRNHHAGEWFKNNERAHKRATGILTAHKKLREEVEQIEEGNAANKLKKNIFVAKKGMETHPAIRDKDDAGLVASMKQHVDGKSKSYARKEVADTLKREGRRELKNPTKREAYHAHYDKKQGVYHIKHTASGKTVEHNVANSGGAALNRADHWNAKHAKGQIKEGVEQIDEISKEKLKDYGKKAMRSVTALHHEADKESARGYGRVGTEHSHSGVKVAPDPKARERSVELTAKAIVRKNYIAKAASKVNPGAARDHKNFDKYTDHPGVEGRFKGLSNHMKRMSGIKEENEGKRRFKDIIEDAVKRGRGRPKKKRNLAGEIIEDVEQLDELSHKKLSQYVVAAKKSKEHHEVQAMNFDNHRAAAGEKWKKDDKGKWQPTGPLGKREKFHDDKAYRREKGITQARRKMPAAK